MRTNRTRARVLAFALTIGATWTLACSAGNSLATPNESPASLLVGSWELVAGCGGLAGGCLDASKLAEPSRYVFGRDGVVTAYRGATQLFRTSYTVTEAKNDPSGDNRPLLTIGGGPLVDPRPLRIRFATSDTLYLDEGCCDRFTFQFRRVR